MFVTYIKAEEIIKCDDNICNALEERALMSL
jgi:hypothetical protein